MLELIKTKLEQRRKKKEFCRALDSHDIEGIRKGVEELPKQYVRGEFYLRLKKRTNHDYKGEHIYLLTEFPEQCLHIEQHLWTEILGIQPLNYVKQTIQFMKQNSVKTEKMDMTYAMEHEFCKGFHCNPVPETSLAKLRLIYTTFYVDKEWWAEMIEYAAQNQNWERFERYRTVAPEIADGWIRQNYPFSGFIQRFPDLESQIETLTEYDQLPPK